MFRKLIYTKTMTCRWRSLAIVSLLFGIYLSWSVSITFAQVEDFQFDHISVTDGLSSPVVRCIAQDSLGFMWFVTQDALNRYDGRTIRVYQELDSIRVSFGIKSYQVMGVDRQGTVWVAGGNLYKYVREADRFVSYEPDQNDPRKPGDWTACIMPDYDGTIWLGTGSGLDRFDPETMVFTRIDIGRSERVNSIADDHTGNIWITVPSGVIRIDKATLQREFFPMDGYQDQVYADTSMVMVVSETSTFHVSTGGGPGRRFDLVPGIGNTPMTICGDHAGRVWIGTYGDGLYMFDPSSGSIARFRNNSSESRSLSSSFVFGLCVDREGNLWISTNNGVNLLSRWRTRFVHVVNNTENFNSVARGEVRTIMEDSRGNIWAGTWGRGLSRWDRSARKFHNYVNRHNVFSPWWVSVIYEDRGGTVWVGGNQLDGLVEWNQKSDTFSKNDFVGRSNMVTAILEDSRGAVWVGTASGLCLYDRRTRDERWYTLDSIQGLFVGAICEDSAHDLWVTTKSTRDDAGSAMFKYDRVADKFVSRYQGFVISIHEDRAHRFWLGTLNGLGLYDRARDTLHTVLMESNGLSGNTLYGILEDDRRSPTNPAGRLWLATNNGLTMYDPDTEEVMNYGNHNGYPFPGLSVGDIPTQAYFRAENGQMLIGLGTGFVIFHPDSIRNNLNIPPMVLTDFKLLNEAVSISSDSPLKVNITQCKSIVLTHDQNTFSFEFAALDYTNPATNQYAHQLVGFDPAWIHTGTRNFAQYTNVPPGEYTFRVKGSNNAGRWNEQGTSIEIIITPPWWKTLWAYIGYCLVVAAIFLTIRRSEKHREQLRHEAELERTRAQSLVEVDNLKSRFFANISHEFRTPLTLIKGPVEGMLNEHQDEKNMQSLSMIHRNTDRLLRLVNQLLDLSKLESGAMKLQAGRADVVPFVKGITSSFESSAGRGQISIAIHAEETAIEIYFDKDKLEKILSNLLSNSFKFTPDGGKVCVKIRHSDMNQQGLHGKMASGQDKSESPKHVIISVSDTGIGIPVNELPRVFDRFYQVDQSQTREYEGSGIGLALTKELVELHHGTIEVRSEIGKGTEFIVTLPLGRDHLEDDEIIEVEEVIEKRIDIPSSFVTMNRDSTMEEVQAETISDKSFPIVLLIEDNADVRSYIKQYLTKEYQVVEAHDGAEGVEKALKATPDLIISDVMMPKMDGYQVCKTLKLDEKTSHIPIILLTARAGREDKIEGLETGADDYLTKPFDAKELQARARNLIQMRKALREKFSTAKVLKPGEIAVTSVDDTFLRKAKVTIETHIGEEEFGVEEFSREMNMSRSQLLRKLTALTGLSARDFIRYIRLHRAMDLLKQNAGTVSEISYTVGFSSPAYFTKCFHEQFGTVPTEVRNQK